MCAEEGEDLGEYGGAQSKYVMSAVCALCDEAHTLGCAVRQDSYEAGNVEEAVSAVTNRLPLSSLFGFGDFNLVKSLLI